MVIFVMYLNSDVCIFMVKFTNKQKIRMKLGLEHGLLLQEQDGRHLEILFFHFRIFNTKNKRHMMQLEMG